MNFQTELALVGLIMIGACTPADGLIANYNGSSVTIRQDTIVNIPGLTPQIEAEAQRVCIASGKRAEYASTIQPSSAAYAEHLFLCL